MKKKNKFKIKWHAAVIAGLFLLLSLASWRDFTNTLRYELAVRFAVKTDAATRTSGKRGSSISASTSGDDKEGIPTASDTDDSSVRQPSASSEEPDRANATQRNEMKSASENSQTNTGTDDGSSTPDNPLLAACKLSDKAVRKLNDCWNTHDAYYLLRLDSHATYYVLKECSSSQVIIGSDNWLFYKTDSDGNTIADFEGTNSFSETKTKDITAAALSAQKEAKKRGIGFALLVAPNKERIYWEKMPDNYVRAEESRTDRLVRHLSDAGVNVISPKNDLLDCHQSTELYYRYDTHWNQQGAYIGVRDILASWGLSMSALSERKVNVSDLKSHANSSVNDDLTVLSGLENIFTDEKEYEIEGTIAMDWAAYKEEQFWGISHFVNKDATQQKSVFLVGDSFRSAMIPALREQFSDVYVTHRNYYAKGLIDEIHPDYLIVEYVERQSNQISQIGFFFE